MTFQPSTKIIFTTSGAHTWTCPPNVNYISLTLLGAGGGGGGGGGGGYGGTGGGFFNYGAGGGGASGGAGGSGTINTFSHLKVTPGITYIMTVGAGGTGGIAGIGYAGQTSGGYGIAGSATSFTFPSGIILQSAGGVAGLYGLVGNQGVFSSNGGGGFGWSNLYVGGDGSQGGKAGGSGAYNSANVLLDASGGDAHLYEIYTEIASSYTPNGQGRSFIPFGGFAPSFVSGNNNFDPGFFSDATASTGPNNGSYYGGGAGGILNLSKPIPIYYIGVDYNSISSLILPAVHSLNWTRLGNGQDAGIAGAGDSVSSSGVSFFRDGTATNFGFGAGGLPGPGGGGGAGRIFNLNYGGNGYHGDNGLGGLIIISY